LEKVNKSPTHKMCRFRENTIKNHLVGVEIDW